MAKYVCQNCGKTFTFNKMSVFHSPPPCPECGSSWIRCMGPGLDRQEETEG